MASTAASILAMGLPLMPLDVATTASTVAPRLQIATTHGSIAVNLLACNVARMMVVAKKASRAAMTMECALILRPRKWSIHSLLSSDLLSQL